MKLIDTLRTVTEGKIYVENERSRLTHRLAMILEQMRLCLAVQDFIRAQIISKKISTRFFEDAKYADLKLKFYGYMIELGQHEGDYLDICKNYRQVHETSTIQEDAVKKIQTLKNVILYVVLAKYDNEQSDLIHRVEADKLLEEIPKYKAVVEKFTTNEIISQATFCDSFEKELRDGVEGSLATDVFSRNEVGEKRWTD